MVAGSQQTPVRLQGDAQVDMHLWHQALVPRPHFLLTNADMKLIVHALVHLIISMNRLQALNNVGGSNTVGTLACFSLVFPA